MAIRVPFLICLESVAYAAGWENTCVNDNGRRNSVPLATKAQKRILVQLRKQDVHADPERSSDPSPQHWDDKKSDCTLPLIGTRNRRMISDSAITASSHWTEDTSLEGPPAGWEAFRSRMDIALSCWLAGARDSNQWLQWDFGSPKKISIIQTKGRLLRGREDDEQWVSEYKVEYSEDGVKWKWFDKIFRGNANRFFLKENKFDPPLIAQKIKLHPTQWHNQIAMRVEMLGCDAPACYNCDLCATLPVAVEYNVTEQMCALCAQGRHMHWPCVDVDEPICRCMNTTSLPSVTGTKAATSTASATTLTTSSLPPLPQQVVVVKAIPVSNTLVPARQVVGLAPCDSASEPSPPAPQLVPAEPGSPVTPSPIA